MKRTTCITLSTSLILFLLSLSAISQTYDPFTIRENIETKGRMLIVGNNILGNSNLPFNDNTKDNQDISMQYIDIDGDGSTFSSSSADLIVPPQSNGDATSCYRISYAGLYWSAILQSGSRSNINQIKFKVPGSSSYVDINGEVVYDAIVNPIPVGGSEPPNTPYACYANVTNLLGGLTDLNGTYTVANVTSSLGFNNSTGLAAGWTLVVIYEDPNLIKKSFNIFDGFGYINNSHFEEVPISGFRTPLSGPIDIQIAYAALDGDKTTSASKLEIDGKQITTPLRGANKFFSSVIENTNGVSNPRNPSGSNTLGFDTGFLEIKNAEPQYIQNNVSSSSLIFQVPRGQSDPIFFYFSAFAVDIIAPEIELIKLVKDTAGNEIDGSDVFLGQQLFYEISYQNTGNDNVDGLTIKDILPENIIFDPTTDIDLSNSGGATIQSYDPITRTIIFNIPNSSVQINDPKYVIRLAAQIVPNCYDLSTACSNEIRNQAFSSYTGIINTDPIVDEGSLSSDDCFFTPQPTNFLVNISNCQFQRDEVLCGSSAVLTAANGYDSYSWSTSPTGTPVIGTTQSITVNNLGTYYVRNTASSTCLSIDEEITVIPYGNTNSNPVIPFADEVLVCPNDGKPLPNIFLCGANATRLINTGISDAASIIWEKLDETSCTDSGIANCANENTSCTWNQVGTGGNYLANTSGQFRVVINYAGGCFSIFYFDVFQNLLNPTATVRDLLCTTVGQITVGGVPAGYEYSLNPSGPYQASNIFPISTPDYYTVYIRQVGVDTNPCIFETPSLYVRQRNFTVSTIITQPFCNGDKGSVIIAANDALPQYNYSIYQGATLVNSVGPIAASDYTFNNLNPGTYTINVSTDDGCVYSEDIVIVEPTELTATSALTTPLTCVDGEITVYPVGGTPPYYYYTNSTTVFETVPTIAVSAPGTFDITVVDSNNCSAQTSITVNQIPEPVFNITTTDVLCYGDSSGEIQFIVTNANGYTVAYSIDNGVTYLTNPTFSNLIAGTYPTILRYSLNGTECFGSPQDIIINEPAAAVTATAGVSELAGCGPSGEGRVRITNPQGGVAPYEYSFDNQATWTSANDAYLAPGTYTLYIRDANGCVFPMPNVVVDPEPLVPTIDISDPDFNCDGSANSTVTITNPGTNAFTYTYLIDGVENPNTSDPTVFLNVPDGPHTISVAYQLQTVPTFSNLLNETFGYGEDTSSPGMNPVYYCFERQVAATQCKGSIRIQDGDYSVTSRIVSPYGAWVNPIDHTPATSPATPKGRYLVVNIGSTIPAAEVLYEKQINDIIPNQPINVEFFAMNLLRSGNNQANADLRVALVDGAGTEISSFSTGGIPKTESWENYAVSLNPGANTSLKFIVRSNVQLTSGNDVAIDDIRVFQLPTACITQVDFPIVIGTGNAFDATIVSATDVTCFGASDGTITISAQNFDTVNGFQYSLDAGVTWVTQLTSPHTITGLATGNQNIQIRYEDAVDTCEFVFNQNIGTPALVGVSATATPITCLDGATVTATGSGGTPSYSYELLDTSLNLISNFPNTGILTNVAAGDYIIRVTDANNCTETTTLNLINPTPPTASIINADYCYDATNAASLEVSATGGIAPYEYNINGSAFQSNPVFNNLAPGTYAIIVRDAYGCTFTLPAETIATQVNVSAVLTKELDCTTSPNAIITGTISDGYPTYTYAVSYNGGAFTDLGNVVGTSFTYDTTTDGSYQFQVTDSNNCSVLSNVTTVSPVELPTATTTSVNPSCNGDANGSVQIIPANGVGPYEFSFDGSAFTTTSSYTGLIAGTYAYEVRDSKACIVSGSVTLTEPTALVVTASATAFSCNASNTNQSATVTIDLPTTGTAPYLYSFNSSGYSSTNTLTVNDNGTDQIIAYSVQDAQGCTAGGSLTISQLDPPTDLAFSSTAVTCLATSSTVTLTATDGVGILEYETIAPSPIIVAKQTSNVFAGLTPGTYLFRVTDANGCYYTESYTIDAVTPINIVGFKISDVFCFGDTSGAIQFTVSGFAGTYSSALTSGTGTLVQTGTNIDLTGLIAGTYTLEVTDDITGCTANETIVINQPASGLTFTATSTNVFCSEDNSQITISASNGTPNYTYAAVVAGAASPVTYSNSNVITVDTNSGANLVWDVYVQDANGCITINTVTIIEDALPTVTTPTIASNQCTVTSGFTFTATGADGVAPYQYSINGGASYQASPTFTANTPGTYTVTIRDANGCTAMSPTPTIIYAPLTSVPAITKELDCSASPNAIITVTISGGNAPFTYTVQKGAGVPSAVSAPIAGPTFTYAVAPADVDSYTFEISDANSCTTSSTITIDPIINPTATTTSVNPSCNGDANGSVQIIPANGVGPYEFSFDGSAFTTTSSYTGLIAGTYAYEVRDSKACIVSGSVTLTEPTALVVTASATAFSCNASNTNQSATVTIDLPTTGTAPYLYSFNSSGYSSTNTLTVNDNGTDQIIAYSVQDAQGCTAGGSLTISQLDPPTDLAFSSTAVTCLATSSTVTLTATDGVGILEYETIAPSPIIVAKQTSNVFAGLTPGTYLFRVTDANGCYYTESYTIDAVTPINIVGFKISDVFCFGDTSGAIQFTVSGFAGTYSSALTSGTGTLVQTGTNIDLTGLIAGTYTLEVTDDITGCTANETIVINQPASGLTFTATSTNVFCSEDNSQITISASNGTPNYTYAAVVAGAASPVTYSNSNVITVDTNSGANLVWDVYVQDANGCVTMNAVTITADPLPTVTVPPLASNQCLATSGFTFTANGASGVPPYQYSINGGASYQTSSIFTLNTPGTYTVTIRDANGCTGTSPTPVEIFEPISTSVSLTKDLTCSVPQDASINIVVSGGNAPYTYEVSTDGGTTYNSIAGSPYTTSLAGNYQFRVTDANSCARETNTVTVNTPVTPVITSVIQTQTILCSGEDTAAISVNYNNTIGKAPFVINVLNTTTTTNYGTQTAGLAAGDYTITLTDANGCFDTDTITILEPSPVVIDYTVTPITCGPGGISLGEIVINTVTGGTPNYIYHVTGVNGYDQELLNQTGATQVFEVVDFGLYELIVTDSNGCSVIEQNILVASPPDDLDIDIATTVDCLTGGEADVSIGTATTISGTGPFYFAIYTGPGMVWDGIPGGSPTWQLGSGSPVSTTFTGLIPDVTYTFIVYDDDTMCYYFETSTTPIETNSTFNITGLTAENVTCRGNADGNVSFNINSAYGVDTDVDYEVYDSQTLASITPTAVTGSGTVPAGGTLSVNNLGLLDIGNYVVVITETTGPNAGCGVSTIPFNITESAVDLSLTASVSRNENCNELGIITAIARDGTAPYQFILLPDTNPAPIASDPSWAAANTFNASADDYIVYVKDAYGCIRSAGPLTVDIDPLPTIDPVPLQCFDGSPISITLAEGTGTAILPLTYAIGTGGIPGSYQTSPSFAITAAGTYDLFIKDGNGCLSSTTYTYVVEPQLLLQAELSKDLDCTASPNAEILLTPSGGNGTYITYEVSTDGGTTYNIIPGSIYTATTSGTYQFRVSDSQTCISESNIITIDPLVPVALTETHADVTCNGGSDGSIVVTASGGVAPYEYSIDNGVNFQASNVFSGLNAAGTYNIVVRDDKDCTSAATLVTITQPTVVDGTIILTQGLTCGVGNATQAAIVTVTGSGGTAPYTYSFDGGVNYTTTNTFTTFTAGTVSALVKDANGCIIAAPIDVIVPALSIPTDLDFTATAVTCSALTSDVTLATTNGVGPLTYAIIAPASATGNTSGDANGIYTGLLPDTYTFTVTDANGCSYTESYTVNPVININVSGLLVSDVSCNGGSDGAVNFTVGSFASTYSYTINGGAAITGQTSTTINLTGLSIGNQVIVVTDEITDCTATTTITVSEPSVLTLNETVNINATCNFDAQVTVEATGGTPNYRYAFVQDGVAPIAADYTASASAVLDPTINVNWDVWVIDANDCTDQIDVVIATDPLPTINPVAPQCFEGSPITITLVQGTVGAIAPFTYSLGTGGIAGGYQASDTFTISAAGTYDLFIRDGNGCIVTTTYLVEPQVLLDADLTQDLTCAVDASISLTPSGGTGTYITYEVSINGAAYAGIAGSPYTTTTDGTYQFRVTDSQGCEAESAEIIVTPRTTPTFTFTQTNVSCNGGSNGSIVVTASNGVAPYEYSIDNGVNFQASNVFSGLNAAGTYNIVVRDDKDCTSAATLVTITQPALVDGTIILTQGLTCGVGNATQAAIVTVTGSGGTAPYTYSFDGGVNYTTTNTFTTFTAGTVSALVKDANGCIIAAPIDVIVPALSIPTDLDFTATAVTCSALTSDVTLATTNGVGPLTYAIIAPASATGNTSGDANGIYTGLLPDTYTFTVTDANGCSYTESYTVNPVININVSGLLVSDVSCNGGSDGAVNFTVGSFASTYSYTINGGAAITGQTSTTINLTGLSIGNQVIVVTDEITDCTATTTITVSEPSVLTLNETVNINATCNFDAQVTVEATGGTPNYRYAFVQDGFVPTAADYTASASAVLDPTINVNWDVWVIDANDCTDQIDVFIATDALPTVTVPAWASNQCNLTGDPYTFTVTSTTGIAPFTYSIGSGFQSSAMFTVASPGDYFVTVRDDNGCEAISATSVTVYPTIDLSPSVTALPSCTDDDGEITMTGSGGSGNYTYTISPTPGSISITTNVISGVPAGTYTVTITDTITLCTRDITVIVDAPTPVTFTTTPTPVSCTGGSDGIITVNLPASNDNPIYSYSLDGGVTSQTSNVFSGLAAGTYNVTVTSGRNCALTQAETVIDPNPITVPVPTVVEYACTANTNTTVFATITVNGVTGGSSNYTIYEFIRGGTIVQANASNVYTEADLLGGTYTINVYDDNGCFETTTATIQPFIRLDTLDITVDNAITCTNDEDITVSVTSTGGTPTNLAYTVEDVDGTNIGAVYNQTNPTGVFTSLPVGNYLVTVLNLDSGCSLQTTHFIDEPNTFDLTIDNVVDVTCFTDSDGSAEVTFIDRSPTPTDESGAFNYTIVDALGNPVSSGTVANAGPTTISGLVSGTYTITASLTNTPFCTISKSFTINAPTAALAISETHTEITCVSGNNDGSISASAAGGWPGSYEYQLELTSGTIITPFGSVSNFTDLTAGDYIVSVRDSRGCIASTNVLLVIPTPIDAQIAATPTLVSCFGDTNASITVSNVTGGQGANYSYTLNMLLPTVTASGPQNSNVFGGLGAGTYNVTVRDGWNCEFTTADVVITEPTDIISSLVKATSQTCLIGSTLTLSATGGTGLYEYSDTINFATVLGSFASDVTFNVTPGTYQYYVRDANVCGPAISNEITIDPLPALTVNIDATNATINCTGDITGVIVANATGGLGNYTYILQDNFGTDITPAPTQDSPGVFTELPAGIYQVRVTSGIDCEAVSTQVQITEPDFALQVSYTVTDVACNGGNDGVLEIIATGGTGIIKYALSPQLNQFFDNPIFEDLPAGTYQAIAQDELGCFVLLDFVVDEPAPVMLSLVPNSMVPEACVDELDGEFSIELSGGNLPYSVSLDDINGTYTTGTSTQTQFDFTGLAGGDHIVFVRDNLGCESEWNITFPESVRIVTELEIAYCTDNLNNASINMVTAIVDDTLVDLADIDYALDGGAFQVNNSFMDILPGNHFITVRHTNTCESIINFEIEQFDPLQLVIAEGSINEIVASSNGGSGVYEYEVQFENSSNTEFLGSTNIFPIYESGNYTVTVTDSNGCVASATAFFEYIDVCITNYFTPNNDGRQDEWGPGCTDQYPNLSVNIFDRYGREVSKLRVGQKWDGKYNGTELPSGDYWYVVKLNDERDDREFVGHFTLYR